MLNLKLNSVARWMEADTSLVVWMAKSNNMIFGAPEALMNQVDLYTGKPKEGYGLKLYTGNFVHVGHGKKELIRKKRKIKLKRAKQRVRPRIKSKKRVYYLDNINQELDIFNKSKSTQDEEKIKNFGIELPRLENSKDEKSHNSGVDTAPATISNQELNFIDENQENFAIGNNSITQNSDDSDDDDLKPEDFINKANKHKNKFKKTKNEDKRPELYNLPKIIDKNAILWMCVLNNHGGRTMPMIRYNLQFWRYFTSLFLHVSTQHLVGNLLLLFFLIKILKINSKIFSSQNLSIAFAGGFLANVLAGIPNYDQLGVGFSPVVYSILGVICFDGFKIAPKGLKIYLNTQELMIVAITFIFGILSNGESSDVSSHVMGIVFGYGLRYLNSLENLENKK